MELLSFFNVIINTSLPKTLLKEVPIWEIIKQSNSGIGWVINLLLLLLFGYSVFIFVERILTIRAAKKEANKLSEEVKKLLLNNEIEKALALCKSSDTPMAKMLEELVRNTTEVKAD